MTFAVVMIWLWCTFSNVHSAASGMVWNKMSQEWWSTEEAKVKSNTYSCKTGSLCDSGWPPAENSTHSARAHTPGHNGRQLTNREWEKHSEMIKNKRTENNRKLQQISADSIWKSRNVSGRDLLVIPEARVSYCGSTVRGNWFDTNRHIIVASQHSQWCFLECNKNSLYVNISENYCWVTQLVTSSIFSPQLLSCCFPNWF